MRQQFRATIVFMLAIGAVVLSIGVGTCFRFMIQRVLDEGGARLDRAVDSLTSTEDPADYVRRLGKLYKAAQATEDKSQVASQISPQITAIIYEEGYDRIQRQVESYAEETGIDACFIVTDYNPKTKAVVGIFESGFYDFDLQEIFQKIVEKKGSLTLQGHAEDEYEGTTSVFYAMGDGSVRAVCGAPLDKGDPTAGAMYFIINTDDVTNGVRRFAAELMGFMILLLGIAMLLVNRRFKRTLIEPLESITSAARGYTKDRKRGTFNERRFAALDLRTNNEVEELGHVLADMEGDLIAYVEDIVRISAEKERKETELKMAAQIQRSALPDVSRAFFDRGEFEVRASMTPAREVGGDFYDAFLVDDDHLCLVIADVSDKGVPAALFMMASKSTLANNIMMGKSPAETLADTNEFLLASNGSEMFVTIWVGILTISTGELVAANGGHEYPVLQRPHGAYALYKDRHGLVVGGLSGIAYTDYKIMLKPGSKLFVYTDGVPEATDAEGQMFGLGRMVDALNGMRDATPEETLCGMRRVVDEFVGEASQFDDLTMLCLEYRGVDVPPQNTEKEAQ